MPKRKVKQAPARGRHTIILTAATSMRLGVEAQRRGLDRSAAAEAILAENLGHIVISIRGQAGEAESAA